MNNKNNNYKLISTLISKNIIKAKTLLTANYVYTDFNGTNYKRTKEFQVKVIKDGAIIAFDGETKINFKIPYESIVLIDGMKFENTAKAFELKTDGTLRPAKIDPITGKPVRRGRKPNWVKEKMKELEA